MSTDQEWARDLFERSRQGEEPAWAADPAEIMRSGQRRNRIRTLTASGSVVATAAVVTAVGIGVAGSTDRQGARPRPGQAATAPATSAPAAVAVDPSKVLEYASFNSFSTRDDKSQTTDFLKKYYIAVPNSTARDTMQLLSRLDPTLSHFVNASSTTANVRLVPDTDPMAQDMAVLDANARWTGDGKTAPSSKTSQTTTPTGNLGLSFADSANIGPDETQRCNAPQSMDIGMLNPVQEGGGWHDAAQWGPCTRSTLPDGSVLQSATKSYGPYTVVSAMRRFPNGAGSVEMLWSNYVPSAPVPGAAGLSPDPKSVLSSNPITAEKMVAALSDASLVPPLAPVAVASPPPTMLQASDFGAGWTLDTATPHGKTSALVVDDGCVNEQNPVVAPQPMESYIGTTPSGISVTANAGLNVMKAGSGPSWMAELRKHGTGGCNPVNLPYSRDTMSPLPAGTGDDAFIEHWYGQGSETFFIRFGDSILRVDVTTSDMKMPAFTQADRDWFAGLAAKAAARHSGKS